MPEFDLLLDADNAPLFTDQDPLTFTLPDPETGSVRVFHAVDRPIFPDDRVVSLQSQPRTYIIETLASNVVDTERRPIREQLHTLFNDGIIDPNKMMELIEWLTEQRDAARKRLARQKLHRPTGGPSPSSPSLSTGRATSGDGFS